MQLKHQKDVLEMKVHAIKRNELEQPANKQKASKSEKTYRRIQQAVVGQKKKKRTHWSRQNKSSDFKKRRKKLVSFNLIPDYPQCNFHEPAVNERRFLKSVRSLW